MKKYRFALSSGRFILLVLLVNVAGCFHGSHSSPSFSLGDQQLENPLFIPVVDSTLLWDQLSNELDDYFVIDREERVRTIGNEITEGWIVTHSVSGSTILEPWRKDSTSGFEKQHATLQTIRRWARVRVIPTGGGFLLEVNVFKELEDLEKPQGSSIGGEVLRYDTSLSRIEEEPSNLAGSNGWIPLGRDVSLEQEILSHLLGRMTDPTSSGVRGAINISSTPLPSQN